MMKDEYLEHDQLSDELFMKLYIENPVNALSIYFLELLDIITFWEWEAAGGTYTKAIQYKRETPLMTLIQAIERAEDEARGIASGFWFQQQNGLVGGRLVSWEGGEACGG